MREKGSGRARGVLCHNKGSTRKLHASLAFTLPKDGGAAAGLPSTDQEAYKKETGNSKTLPSVIVSRFSFWKDLKYPPASWKCWWISNHHFAIPLLLCFLVHNLHVWSGEEEEEEKEAWTRWQTNSGGHYFTEVVNLNRIWNCGGDGTEKNDRGLARVYIFCVHGGVAETIIQFCGTSWMKD